MKLISIITIFLAFMSSATVFAGETMLSSHVCDATGAGRCVYISPSRGTDNGLGTKDQPYKTFAPINEGLRLESGSVILLDEGVHDTSRVSDVKSTTQSTCSFFDPQRPKIVWTGLYLRGLNGIRVEALPGTTPIVSSSGNNSDGITILQSRNITVSGIKIEGTYHRGIRVSESQNVQLSNIEVTGIDGCQNDGATGVEIHSSHGVKVSNLQVADAFDRRWRFNPSWNQTERVGPSQGSMLVGVYRSTGVDVSDSEFAYSSSHPSQQAACIAYVHAGPEEPTNITIEGSRFSRCRLHPINLSTPSAVIRGNRFVASPGIAVTGGGPAYTVRSIIVDNNDFDSGRLLELTSYGEIQLGGGIQLTNNRIENALDTRLIDIFRWGNSYQSPSSVLDAVSKWTVDGNCVGGDPIYGLGEGWTTRHSSRWTSGHEEQDQAEIDANTFGPIRSSEWNRRFEEQGFVNVDQISESACRSTENPDTPTTKPTKVSILQPQKGETIRGHRIRVRWAAVANAESYKVVVKVRSKSGNKNSRFKTKFEIPSKYDCQSGDHCVADLGSMEKLGLRDWTASVVVRAKNKHGRTQSRRIRFFVKPKN